MKDFTSELFTVYLQVYCMEQISLLENLFPILDILISKMAHEFSPKLKTAHARSFSMVYQGFQPIPHLSHFFRFIFFKSMYFKGDTLKKLRNATCSMSPHWRSVPHVDTVTQIYVMREPYGRLRILCEAPVWCLQWLYTA